ncbi:hypothetical protein MtrunA17_Chr5g0444481 [Medicago truncatula]|uniref:Late embryogenesis abundant protein LEA-2 subgroup domain-containing protein n=1 Tax=Medicago truncatula TaxID=3880 RepID=A0A396HZ99_MEDTR|nr:hypothetical protein MtrunA17_Chr5g0444481 [Medicago truncatula]
MKNNNNIHSRTLDFQHSATIASPPPIQCIFCILLLLFILMGCLYVSAYSHLPILRLDSASQLNSQTINKNTKLTAEWKITLSLSNPNYHLRISYHHDSFDPKIFYKDQQIILDTSLLQSSFNHSSNVVEMKLGC